MTKKIFLMCIFNLIILVSCTGKFDSSVEVSKIMDKIKAESSLKDGVEEDIKSIDIAERYGLTLEEIEEGKLYYTKEPETSDKVMIIKARNEDSVENVERALNSELIRLSDAWKNDEKEAKKIENHVLKTRGKYIMLVIANNAERIEKIFDDMIKPQV